LIATELCRLFGPNGKQRKRGKKMKVMVMIEGTTTTMTRPCGRPATDETAIDPDQELSFPHGPWPLAQFTIHNSHLDALPYPAKIDLS
jgi:hypothetical protein